MTLYLIFLVIFGICWIIWTVFSIMAWNTAKGRPKSPSRYTSSAPYDALEVKITAKRMLWALLGVILIPFYPLAIPAALLLALIKLIRSGLQDLRDDSDSVEEKEIV